MSKSDVCCLFFHLFRFCVHSLLFGITRPLHYWQAIYMLRFIHTKGKRQPKQNRSKNNQQTLNKISIFTFANAQSEHSLRVHSHREKREIENENYRRTKRANIQESCLFRFRFCLVWMGLCTFKHVPIQTPHCKILQYWQGMFILRAIHTKRSRS